MKSASTSSGEGVRCYVPCVYVCGCVCSERSVGGWVGRRMLVGVGWAANVCVLHGIMYKRMWIWLFKRTPRSPTSRSTNARMGVTIVPVTIDREGWVDGMEWHQSIGTPHPREGNVRSLSLFPLTRRQLLALPQHPHGAQGLAALIGIHRWIEWTVSGRPVRCGWIWIPTFPKTMHIPNHATNTPSHPPTHLLPRLPERSLHGRLARLDVPARKRNLALVRLDRARPHLEQHGGRPVGVAPVGGFVGMVCLCEVGRFDFSWPLFVRKRR